MCADCIAFMEMLQRHKEDFSSLPQHMGNCYKALFTDKLICVSASVTITHPENESKSIHALRKNSNTVAMLTGDVSLRHFRKGMYHCRIGSCALLSLLYSSFWPTTSALCLCTDWETHTHAHKQKARISCIELH